MITLREVLLLHSYSIRDFGGTNSDFEEIAGFIEGNIKRIDQ